MNRRVFSRGVMGLAVMTVAAFVGCNQGVPGGPGTTDDDKPMFGQTDNTFNLSVPMTSSSLKQGDKTVATIGIKRAKNFDQDVALSFGDVPEGVTVEPTKPVIKHGDKDAKITFTAVDKATLGDFQIKVTGHPSKGGDAEIDFKLTVAAMDTFTLSVSGLSLKQGESETVSIRIKRDKTFNQDVALKFDDLPPRVTFSPADPVIAHGDKNVEITFTADDEAPLGDFPVKVTGHPSKGADAQDEFQLAVVAMDTFTLSTPGLSLKQGETAKVSIGIKRDKKFDQDVSLKFGDMPTGVTVEPATLVIKKGDSEGQFTLTAVADAALGSFGINVTGHPTKGADASVDLKLTMSKAK